MSDSYGTLRNGEVDYTKRVDVLIEASRTAHQELMFRLEHRDNWLKLELAAQLVIVGIASGIEVLGVKANAPTPKTILALAVPAAFILATLYFTEDLLAGLLSKHRGRLSLFEAKLAGVQTSIPFFEASPELQEFLLFALPIRLSAQFVAFVAIPVGITVYRFVQITIWSRWTIVELVLDLVLLAGVVGFLVIAFVFRRCQIKHASASRVDDATAIG